MKTAQAGTSGQTAVVPHAPIYTAPAAHNFPIAPAAHSIPLAPAGKVYTGPAQQSSGIGIHTDHNA